MSRPPERSAGLLVIVPCSLLKIWGKFPEAGPTAAADAYIGPPFKVNRRYAERAGGDWVVLSASTAFPGPPMSFLVRTTSRSNAGPPTRLV
jgi:hypothetical protein